MLGLYRILLVLIGSDVLSVNDTCDCVDVVLLGLMMLKAPGSPDVFSLAPVSHHRNGSYQWA